MTQSDQINTLINTGVARICAGCGTTAPGMVPDGWIIIVKGRGMEIRECPYCPECQAKR